MAPNPNNRFKNMIIWGLIIFGFVWLYQNISTTEFSQDKLKYAAPIELSYGEFYGLLADNKASPKIKSVDKTDSVIKGEMLDGAKFYVNTPDNDPDLYKVIRENVADFSIKPPKTLWSNIFWSVFPTIVFVGLLWLLFYRNAGQAGGRIWAFGKSRARQVSEDKVKVTFEDVAGVDEAKDELNEVIEFLKDPKKFQRLGGKIPKGVLLMGPPGTGKTLLAKAVSGEANVPFLTISGSDFVELFVGVGASRVRDLFEQARKSAKLSGRGCIIFIDEIDAVGRQRFAGIGGGHDEREQTLNALLVEMDGFDTQEGVILIAATNRPDVLDPALLRPGRFDRQIVIDRPDINGRLAILKVHTKKIKLSEEVDLKIIARQTPGFSGADIANLANEAALLAARQDKEAVAMAQLGAAIERVMAGPERKSRVISEYEKKIVAYHESGHALLSLLVPRADPLHKVSIIPRGTAALGYTMQLPIEDRYIITRQELLARLIVLLGGRASEDLKFNEATTGAHNDLDVATQIARRMVCEFGMSDSIGHVTLGRREHQVFLGRDIVEDRNYSEQTALKIDTEVKSIVDKCFSDARQLLAQNRDKLEKLVEALLEKEVLEDLQVREIVGMALPLENEKQRNPESAAI